MANTDLQAFTEATQHGAGLLLRQSETVSCFYVRQADGDVEYLPCHLVGVVNGWARVSNGKRTVDMNFIHLRLDDDTAIRCQNAHDAKQAGLQAERARIAAFVSAQKQRRNPVTGQYLPQVCPTR